ncbi:MAG: PASTA domain-containing protein [Ruminiclostridium sp.]|nr:PASTA domain-containing protein [Ruminiclostridium sp.]
MEYNFIKGIAEHTDTIIAIIGIVLALISLILSIIISNKETEKGKARRILIGGISISAATILLISCLCANKYNYDTFHDNYIEVPNVEALSCELARNNLTLAGFDSDEIQFVGEGSSSINEGDCKVIKQHIEKGTYVEKGTKIVLDCENKGSLGTYQLSEKTETVLNESSATSTGDISIKISEYQFFDIDEGFHYEEPYGDGNMIVDFDRGISGHFSYSRELTESELESWRHGGEILDSSGNKIIEDPTFFSTPSGVFAVEFPKNMPSGNYTYVLYHFINDFYCDARINFTIN